MVMMREAVHRMGLERHISFAGDLGEEEFAALLASCQALIFPSLYEAFGVPVLEAVAFEKPVLCSGNTSLPEVAGDAALYFDPRKPNEILEVLEQFMMNPQLREELMSRAVNRSSVLGDTKSMAREYLQIFDDVINGRRFSSTSLLGIYPDRWTQEKVVVVYPARSDSRLLRITLEVPTFYPYDYASVKVSEKGTPSKVYRIMRGESSTILHPFGVKGGSVEFFFERIFRPKEFGINNDERWLGCICLECSVKSGTDCETLLESAS